MGRLIPYLPIGEVEVMKAISTNDTVIGPHRNNKQLMARSQQANKAVKVAPSKGIVSLEGSFKKGASQVSPLEVDQPFIPPPEIQEVVEEEVKEEDEQEGKDTPPPSHGSEGDDEDENDEEDEDETPAQRRIFEEGFIPE
ncbi:uncharacterized protein LOC125493272 [Beta vulgaris subsp. vulgaris]|uniref:uncharacterized protein LOC125493272 n=1 Tax=Beta vulgaris subsp. vulgaris TaxID=3555 RepID=UPI002036FE17|nr:uncharacterized protein LOC125493272 [Beta vulgaris subsp. vulgaris]